MSRPRCYVAGPLGFTEAGRHYQDTVLLPALREHVEVVDPWSLTTADEIAAAREHGRERVFALSIGRRNTDAIRSCALLVAVLDGPDVDSGTAAEVGFAAALGITCHGLRTDLRQSGEPGVAVNLQVESFIADTGGTIAASLQELLGTLA